MSSFFVAPSLSTSRKFNNKKLRNKLKKRNVERDLYEKGDRSMVKVSVDVKA